MVLLNRWSTTATKVIIGRLTGCNFWHSGADFVDRKRPMGHPMVSMGRLTGTDMWVSAMHYVFCLSFIFLCFINITTVCVWNTAYCCNHYHVPLALKSQSKVYRWGHGYICCVCCESAIWASQQDICEIRSAFIRSTRSKDMFSIASFTVCDGLDLTLDVLLCPYQASPDVDEEGFSLRPGDEGEDILLEPRQLCWDPCLQNYWPVWLSDSLDECFSALNRPNQ